LSAVLIASWNNACIVRLGIAPHITNTLHLGHDEESDGAAIMTDVKSTRYTAPPEATYEKSYGRRRSASAESGRLAQVRTQACRPSTRAFTLSLMSTPALRWAIKSVSRWSCMPSRTARISQDEPLRTGAPSGRRFAWVRFFSTIDSWLDPHPRLLRWGPSASPAR